MAKGGNGIQLGNWALWLGALVALVAAFMSLPYTGVILLVLGAVGGYMVVADKDAHQFVVFVLGLWLSVIGVQVLGPLATELAAQLSVLEAVGTNLVMLFASGALVVSLKALARVSGLLK